MAHYAVFNNGETNCNRVVTNKREDLHIIDKNYIKIPNEDYSFVGRIYDFEKNEWTDEYYTPPEPEPTQLDRIEEAVNKSNDELRQEGQDALVEELVANNII